MGWGGVDDANHDANIRTLERCRKLNKSPDTGLFLNITRIPNANHFVTGLNSNQL